MKRAGAKSYSILGLATAPAFCYSVIAIKIAFLKDGKRTDNLTGYRYTVALPEHGLDKIGVRIDGKQLIEKPEGYIEVEFSGLEVNAYESQGHVQFTAKATGISPVRKN